MRPILLFFLLISLSQAQAENYLWVGPEVYYVKRTRQGGSRQDGWPLGVRVGYDRIKDWGFYWGGDALWAQGTLFGRAGDNASLKSRFTDISLEGRIGYTFSLLCLPSVIFTPYAGYGVFQETNNFKDYSPVTAKFRIRYNYGAVGALLYKQFTEKAGAGVNFKCRWMIDGKCHVTEDPDYNELTMAIGTLPQYRIEIPMTYQPDCYPIFCLSPFFEYRQYGEQPNFPFDFMETKLKVAGVNLKIIWNF